MLAEETKFGNYWCTVVLSNNVSPKLVASGRHKINTGETVLYSKREDDQHHQGVVIILKKGLEKCLIEWKPINSRLIKVRLKVRHINTTIIQCYAPTKDSEEDNKETYEQLQAASWDEDRDGRSQCKGWKWQQELRKGHGERRMWLHEWQWKEATGHLHRPWFFPWRAAIFTPRRPQADLILPQWKR